MKCIKNLVLSLALVAGVWGVASVNNKAEAAVLCMATGAVPCTVATGVLAGISFSVAGGAIYHALADNTDAGEAVLDAFVGLGFGALGVVFAALGEEDANAVEAIINKLAEEKNISLDQDVITELVDSADVKEIDTKEGKVIVISVSPAVVSDVMELNGYQKAEIAIMMTALK